MTQELESLTKDELYELAKEHEVEGRSSMDKDELIEALDESAGGEADKKTGLDRPTTTKRAVWKGSITFGLITIPVGLYTAIEDREDGSRIRYKRVSSKSG